jgi:hypothetical protein
VREIIGSNDFWSRVGTEAVVIEADAMFASSSACLVAAFVTLFCKVYLPQGLNSCAPDCAMKCA